jgi:hypothetical protein
MLVGRGSTFLETASTNVTRSSREFMRLRVEQTEERESRTSLVLRAERLGAVDRAGILILRGLKLRPGERLLPG